MNKELLKELRHRRWTGGAGRAVGVVIEEQERPPVAGSYDGYHSSIQRFLKQCRSLELRTVDDRATYSWLAVYPPPLDEQGRPATNVKTYGAAPKFKKWGTEWLHLDAFDANGGLVLSIEHGAVLWAVNKRKSAWMLTFVADSLESWFQHWLSTEFVEDICPQTERRVEGAALTEYAGRCDVQREQLPLPDVAKMQVLSLENARRGDVIGSLPSGAAKLDGQLAWVVRGGTEEEIR